MNCYRNQIVTFCKICRLFFHSLARYDIGASVVAGAPVNSARHCRRRNALRCCWRRFENRPIGWAHSHPTMAGACPPYVHIGRRSFPGGSATRGSDPIFKRKHGNRARRELTCSGGFGSSSGIDANHCRSCSPCAHAAVAAPPSGAIRTRRGEMVLAGP